MVTHRKYTFDDEHAVVYTEVEMSHCTHETNVTL